MDINIIDVVALDEKNNVVNLIIIDDQTWDEPQAHIDALQEKVLKYVAFIDSGEFKKKYATVASLGIVIKVVFEFAPNPEGTAFIKEVQNTLSETGHQLEFVNY